MDISVDTARGARRIAVAVCVLAGALAVSGCSLTQYHIDPVAIDGARLALAQSGIDDAKPSSKAPEGEDDFYYTWERWDDDAEERRRDARERGPVEEVGVGHVIIGEALAIFPGVLIHGMGHLYAGDTRTFRRLSRMGGFGILLAVIGGALVYGGYELDQQNQEVLGYNYTDSASYTLYIAGGAIGGVGAFYILTAWAYDMVDTPRAVRSGGKPPEHLPFMDSLDFFD